MGGADAEVRVTVDEALAEVLLNRPAKRNALTTAMVDTITRFVRGLPQSVRVILVRGEGPAFCGGADLAASAASDDFHRGLFAMLDEFVHQHRIVVSYVHGPAVGAGMEIMLASDLVVMEPRAWCELPPARLGFALDNWSIRRLADIVGLGHARSILLACERVTATRAVEIGLAHEVGNLDDAHALCARVGSYPPLGIAELKAVLNDACYTHELSPEHQRLFDAAWAEARRQRR
ncbi:enoyl-CoA hydratase/isomerase family protein [Corynebacterium pyruviciproducens]|uniref:enoyl-CoA hydratase-related protein n=1 Tax=Corynebacterium pyruviciproducens TaxID=598660 RepID=UPI0024557372|nr:enoyl-CoA hydratase-related protein [Corynebacterium pyruviciproducens]MDH4659127.1 enoyl-CoA hydratase/isomerase family protein [Corynebacterium pyruviciproducens]